MNIKNNSASSLKILSYNANSIGKNPKRQQVLNFLKTKNKDIYVVLDTRFDKNIEAGIRNDWGGEVIFNSKNSQSRGVAIFFRKNLPVEILNTFFDDTGNILSVKFTFESRTLLLTGQIRIVLTSMKINAFLSYKNLTLTFQYFAGIGI